MRCSKMSEAIMQVKKIMKAIISREKLVFDAIDTHSQEKSIENYDRIINVSTRIIKMIERL